MHDDLNSYFGEGITMRGLLRFKGTLRFDGNFEGEVQTSDTFIIGDTGKIKAKVGTGTLFNMGEIIGDVKAKKKISIFPQSNLVGNIDTPAFVAEEGAVFKGTCSMPTSPVPKVARGDDAGLKRALARSGSGFMMPSADGESASWGGDGDSLGWLKKRPRSAVAFVAALAVVSVGYFYFDSIRDLGKSDFARGIVESLSKNDKQKLLVLADTYFDEKQYEKASSLYNRLKDKFPEEKTVSKKLALSLEAGGRMDEAAPYFEEALRSTPDDGQVIDKLAAYYKSEGDTEKVIRLQESVVDLHPGDTDSINRLYALYTGNNRLESALELYSAKLVSSPLTAENYLVIGRMQEKLDRMLDAIDSFSKAVAFDKGNVDARLKLAYAYHKSGDESKAVQEFSAVAKIDGDNVEAINNKGFSNLSRSRIDKAIELFNLALTKDPGNIRSYLGLGTVYSRMGDREKAEKYCMKILDKDPNYAPALNRLAWTYARGRINLDDAEKYSLASMKYNSDAPDYLDTLSEVYFQKKEYQKAVDQIQRALELRPGNRYFKSQLAKFRKAGNRAGSLN